MRLVTLVLRLSLVFWAFSLAVGPCHAQVTSAQAAPGLLATNDAKATTTTAIAVADPLAVPGAEVVVASPDVQGATASAATPASTPVEGNWHFAVSPYLWVPWVYGSLGANDYNFHFYATPDELFSHFRFGLLGLVDTRYKRVVMPLDFVWLRLGDDRALPLSPTGTVANIKL
ncbi:MAG: hypothetical protein WA823_07155, partial [Candidatus Acidiferrales bacterium]